MNKDMAALFDTGEPVTNYSGQTSGMILSILEDKRVGNCSNNGISARFKECLLLDPEIPGIFSSTRSESPPAVVLMRRKIAGKIYKYLVPLEIHKKGIYSMAGGSFAWTCDSRFREIAEYPLPLHDRVE